MGKQDEQTSVEQQLFDDSIHWRKKYTDLKKAHDSLLGKYQGRYFTIKKKQQEIETLQRKLDAAGGGGKAKYKNKSRRGKRR